MVDIDNDILISLVEASPVLWDKSLDSYKDRNLARDTWREVCCALKNDFVDMEDKEKNAFGKEVIKRWGNLRDAFSKSKRRLKESKTSGAGAATIKKYIYADQMNFLNKLFQSRQVAESLEIRVGNEDEDVDNPSEVPLPPQEANCEDPKPREYKRRRRLDEVELKMIKALDEPSPSPHISFVQGLLPHLHSFYDSEILEFQMGVLELISKIKTKEETLPNLKYHHPHIIPTITIPTTIHRINHFPHHKCLIPTNLAQLTPSTYIRPKPTSPQLPKRKY